MQYGENHQSATEILAGTKGKKPGYKTYKNQTVVTSYPDRSKVVYTETQEVASHRFAEAGAWARSLLKDTNHGFCALK